MLRGELLKKPAYRVILGTQDSCRLFLFVTALIAIILSTSALRASETVKISGRDYVRLDDVASSLGMSHEWLRRGKDAQVRLSSEWSQLDFDVNTRMMSLNGTRVYLGFPIQEHDGELCLSAQDLEATLLPVLVPAHSGNPPRLGRVIIDAGHGGRDRGAENTHMELVESHLTLDLSERLQRLLQNRGYEVMITRVQDRYITLEERASIANRMNGDLFVSIHFNAVGSSRVAGIETYALTPASMASSSQQSSDTEDSEPYAGLPNNKWSTLAAYHIQSELINATQGQDRGVKRARFKVLRLVESPAVLIEAGFLSSNEEGQLIQSPAYRERLAKAITNGITRYHQRLNQLQTQ